MSRERAQTRAGPKRGFVLPWAPRGLSRVEAANHVGVSPTLYDAMVRDGRMPQPKVIGGRIVWDRIKVEAYFEALPDRGAPQSDETDEDILARLG